MSPCWFMNTEGFVHLYWMLWSDIDSFVIVFCLELISIEGWDLECDISVKRVYHFIAVTDLD